MPFAEMTLTFSATFSLVKVSSGAVCAFVIAPIPMALVCRAPRFDPLSQWLVQRALESIGQVS